MLRTAAFASLLLSIMRPSISVPLLLDVPLISLIKRHWFSNRTDDPECHNCYPFNNSLHDVGIAVRRWRDRWRAAEFRLQAIEATGKPKLLSQAIEVLLT